MDETVAITAWEYYSFSLPTLTWWGGTKFEGESFNEKLNELGAEGWELVSIMTLQQYHGSSKEVVAVFKRPRGE